jgi:Uma2 family endonuclease
MAEAISGGRMATVKLKPKRWSRAEYDRMIDAGVFAPAERVELIDGEILAMTPQNAPHAMAVSLAQRALGAGCGDGYVVRCQMPLALGRKSEPEPDIAIVPGSPLDYPKHPTTALLVVEAADTTPAFDRETKGPLYASAGIAEYWIVNLKDGVIEQYRDPVRTRAGWSYRMIQRWQRGDVISPLVKPDLVLPVANRLPPI